MLLHIQFGKTSDDEEMSDLNGIMRLEIVRTLLNFGRLEVRKVGLRWVYLAEGSTTGGA